MFALDTPDTILDAYWATAAQILAVLSLAVVVEARAVQRQRSRLPAWFQLLQGVLWASVFVAAALLLPSALEASRPDRSEPDWMPQLTRYVIAGSASILVLSPALLLLVASLAESYYAAKGLALPTRWRAWRQMRESRRLLKRNEQQTLQLRQFLKAAAGDREYIESDQRNFREKIKDGLTIRRHVEISPEDAERMMAWVEWHVIKFFEGSVLLKNGEEFEECAQKSIREAVDRSAEIAQLVDNAENRRRLFRDTSRQLTKARGALAFFLHASRVGRGCVSKSLTQGPLAGSKV